MFIEIAFVFLIAQSNTSSADDFSALKALAGLYDENRSKFDSGRIWFEFTDAYAKDVNDAAKGVVSDSHSAEGSYAFRGNEALYVRTFSEASLAATMTKLPDGQTAHRLQYIRELTDGRSTLADHLYGTLEGKVTRSTIISPGSEEFYKTASVPLSLGFPQNARDDISSTARLIQDGSAGLSLKAIHDDAILDGVKVIRVELQGPYGKREVWVDPERGAISLRVHDETTRGETYDLILGDIRNVAGRGWLPYQRTEFITGGRVFRTVISKVDFGKVPDETFRLEFPKPVAMVDLAKGLTYRPQKVWDLSRLPSVNSPNASVLPAPAGPDPKMPSERESPSFLYTLIALVLSAIVLAAVFLRKWMARSTPR